MKLRQQIGLTLVAVLAWAGTILAGNERAVRMSRIGDISTVEGVRDNALLGYGIVVGLHGTGDRQQTFFTTQTLANALQRMGVQVSGTAIRVNNVAAAIVTATLPPFSRSGTTLDVTISSIGDAKSLEGGLLLLTPLYGPDGQVYATAQGALTLGGFWAGNLGTVKQSNHPTVGRIPAGAVVERSAAVDLNRMGPPALLLRIADFAVANNVAAVISRELGPNSARAVDGRRIEIRIPDPSKDNLIALLARIQSLPIAMNTPPKVVINERTGTVVLGGEVSLGACAILHGALAVEITTSIEVSQPAPFSQGTTTPVPQSGVQTQESPARAVKLREGAMVEELIRGLQAIGATARDIVAILQAIKASGALQAEVEVI